MLEIFTFPSISYIKATRTAGTDRNGEITSYNHLTMNQKRDITRYTGTVKSRLK